MNDKTDQQSERQKQLDDAEKAAIREQGAAAASYFVAMALAAKAAKARGEKWQP
jgi:hypothetical protein